MKRREVVFSPEASADLDLLYGWISAAAGSSVAVRYIERIEVFCAGLEIASERGHMRDDIRTGLRILGFEKRITIAFSVDAERVTIYRLYYGGQNWKASQP